MYRKSCKSVRYLGKGLYVLLPPNVFSLLTILKYTISFKTGFSNSSKLYFFLFF